MTTPTPNQASVDRGSLAFKEYTQSAGPCHFANLNTGVKCGCQRYWDTETGENRCVCEHHACFHVQSSQARNSVVDATDTGARRLADIHAPTAQERAGSPELQLTNIPETLHWSRYLNSGDSLGSLPAIPSQCLLPSETGSRASSLARFNRPFNGLGLNTLAHHPRPQPTQNDPPSGKDGDYLVVNGKRMQIYHNQNGEQCLQSVTEIMSPYQQASPDAGLQDIRDEIALGQKLNDFNISTHRERSSPRNIVGQADVEMPDAKLAAADRPIPSLQSLVADYRIMKHNHATRLEALENASFSYAPLDDLTDGFDIHDTKIQALESRIEEMEKAKSATASMSSADMESQISRTCSSLVDQATRSELHSRYENLAAQVAELQAFGPSFSKPWSVEVILLPFGTQLAGIWNTSYEITKGRSRGDSNATDEWTQTQQNILAVQQAVLSSREQGLAWDDSSNRNGAWLLPRACNERSRVEQRLRSRGLVKTIQIQGPDARDVTAAIMAAFGTLPETLAQDPFSERAHLPLQIPVELQSCIGLHRPWVPLRKLHKDSCLRFLDISEMVTPALWTVPFLTSSVAMKRKGIRRLFITQPDSYVQQHYGVRTADWTWQKLRQLDRFYPESQSTEHTPEADAYEACWAWDERLDPAPSPSLHSSFASAMSLGSSSEIVIPTSPSDHFSSAAASNKSSTTPTTATRTARPVLSVKERNPFRPASSRTISMPASVPLRPIVSQAGKRRVASFDPDGHFSQSLVLNRKRRRTTRSPSRARNTPRCSAAPSIPNEVFGITPSSPSDGCYKAPSSPGEAQTPMEAYSVAPSSPLKAPRGTTPFAYATPFSNAPYVAATTYGEGQGSTTEDLDEGFDQAALSDYASEWEGVDDESEHGESRTLSDGLGLEEGVADGDDDAASESNSTPSEYSSKRPPPGFYAGVKGVFEIHVDEEFDELA